MPVILYSKPDCPPCRMVKQYFNRRGIAYTERSILKQEWLEKLVEEHNVSMVPVIVFSENPEHVVVGYNLARMAHILRDM